MTDEYDKSESLFNVPAYALRVGGGILFGVGSAISYLHIFWTPNDPPERSLMVAGIGLGVYIIGDLKQKRDLDKYNANKNQEICQKLDNIEKILTKTTVDSEIKS